MMFVRMLRFALVLVVVGCASAPTGENGHPRRDPNLITTEDIDRAHYNTAYDLVQALRPSWLQTRGPISVQDPTAGQVVVYLDGTRAGGAGQLRHLRAAEVASLQYLSGTEASARYGLGHGGGAILVTTRIGR